MARFFVPSENINDNSIIINGTDVNHIKNVLRYRIGDTLNISDSSGTEYVCTITSLSDDYIELGIDEKLACDTELGLKLVLFQGLPKKDKMEFIIQKAVELGVTEIYPVNNERSVVKLDDKKSSQKAERWNKISEAAAKQSGRMIVPVVHEPVSYNEALSIAGELDYVMIPYENAEGVSYSAECISEAVKTNSVGVFIGPEGGFAASEIEKAEAIGAKVISLGKRILRTETAGLTVFSVLMFEKEKLNDN